MNLPPPQQLQYLVAVADTLHFGQAADICGISQPALSSQIARLEKSLGVQLVERTTRRVMLTAVGEEVAAQARIALVELEEILAVAGRERRPLEGPLRLGVIPTVAPYLLPPLLPYVRRSFPELQLYLREDQTSRLLDALARGKLDVGVMALPVDVPGLDSVWLADEEFRIVVPSSHRLAEFHEVDHRELAGEDVLLLEDGHCLRDQALAVCDLAGANETEAVRATSISTLVQMVANGLGITLLPASAVPSELRGMDEVVDIGFAGAPPARSLGLVWRRSSGRSAEFEALRDVLADVDLD